ncbi:MAG TPA: GNAT family N-acetyltransferase, partial [Geminicoccaceae bacterium]
STEDARAAGGTQVRVEPVVDLERLGEAWRALEPRSAPSFFQSWGWIGCWLRHLPPGRRPLAVMARCGDEIVGLGVFLSRRERRYGVLPAKTLRLHESGDRALDSVFVEHNGLLADRAHAPAVWAAVLARLTRRGAWDQVLLGGLAGGAAELCLEAAGAHGRHVVVRQRRRSAHLDLAALRRSRRDLAEGLSRNTRQQLARARRLYGAIGPVSLRAAENVEEALAMLDRLKTLHQTSWRRRGQPGCFATPSFETFHRDLIRARFGSGEIQLLAASAGARPIGYLYNFVHGDRVYAYQSGFDDVADGRLKPGLVTHALAIEQAMREGFAIYDFMAGDNRLKASFASHWTEMVWLAVQGSSTVSWVDRRLADLRSRMRAAQPSWLRRFSSGPGPARERGEVRPRGGERSPAAADPRRARGTEEPLRSRGIGTAGQPALWSSGSD